MYVNILEIERFALLQVVSKKAHIFSIMNAVFSPVFLEVEDESHKHEGHEGAKGYNGESHFRIKVVSVAFEGKTRVQRHRMVNEALGDLHKNIHALSISALTPLEYQG